MAALLPISFRNKNLFRIISNISHQCNQEIILQSNLGISNSYNINVSISHPIAAFGKPELFTQEYATLYLTRELLKYADAFVDVGANIGYFCFYVDEYNPNKKPIYFFEPDQKLYADLIINQKKNNKKFIGYDVALSNTNDIITFYRNLTDDSSGSIKNTFQHKHEIEAVSINSIRFDEFQKKINKENLLLKVDVEGAEFEFIEGTGNLFSKIDFLIIELLQESIDQKFPELIINKYGYHAYYINNFSLEYSKAGEYKYVSPYYNWLFTKFNPTELASKLEGSPFEIRFNS